MNRQVDRGIIPPNIASTSDLLECLTKFRAVFAINKSYFIQHTCAISAKINTRPFISARKAEKEVCSRAFGVPRESEKFYSLYLMIEGRKLVLHHTIL